MKTFLKILKWLGITLATIILVFVIAVYSFYPPRYNAPKVDLTASTDSTIVAQGRYLVYGPAHCAECHIKGDRKNISSWENEMLSKPLSGGLEFLIRALEVLLCYWPIFQRPIFLMYTSKNSSVIAGSNLHYGRVFRGLGMALLLSFVLALPALSQTGDSPLKNILPN